MIYLDNAATGGFKPDSVISATRAALLNPANPGRSGHKLSLACMEKVYYTRKLLSDFFGGYGYDRVVFTKNCTEALNIAIFSLFDGGNSKLGDDVIITTVAEHNSVLRPLEVLKGRGAQIEYLPLTGDGEIDLGVLEKLAARSRERLRAAIITLASNVTGTAPDMFKVRQILPPDCLLICDGAQACGHVPIDMQKIGIDGLAVAGHKGMLGVQGSGALLFSDRFNPKPLAFGGTGSESNNLNMPDFYPDRLEAGTLNFPAIVSLAEGALYLTERLNKHAEITKELTARTVEGLSHIAGVKVFSRSNPYGIVAFGLEKMQSEAVSLALSEEYGICVRAGLHCAPLMHGALKSDGLVRASFSAFTPPSAVDALISAIKCLSSLR